MTLIVDSYAWVEFLSAGKAGPLVREHIESAEELITPDLVLAEVARVLGRRGLERAVIGGHLRAIGALSEIRGVDIDIALESVRADADLRSSARTRGLSPPSFADCIILGFARQLGGKVLTADAHFRGLEETLWIGA